MANSGRKNIDWSKEPLGQERDSVIASRLGCSRVAVAYARRQRGILSPVRRPGPTMTAAEAIERAGHLVGKVSDRQASRESGVSISQVRKARIALGIRPRREDPSKRIDWDKVDFSSKPARLIAAELGLSITSGVAHRARRARGMHGAFGQKRVCPCGSEFKAYQARQRFCGYRCQRYHWQMRKAGHDPRIADLMIALWAFKRRAKEASNGLGHINGTAG